MNTTFVALIHTPSSISLGRMLSIVEGTCTLMSVTPATDAEGFHSSVYVSYDTLGAFGNAIGTMSTENVGALHYLKPAETSDAPSPTTSFGAKKSDIPEVFLTNSQKKLYNLLRKGWSTVADLEKITGWKAVSARLTVLRQSGITIDKKPSADGANASLYRITTNYRILENA